MPLLINNTSLSLTVQRHFADHTATRARAAARLASGNRIGAAADDPAGQAIASRMLAGMQGLGQARHNIGDATSLLQVADSSLASIGDSLQRLRELAVAAGNGALSDPDRDTLQNEADQILLQITQVGATKYNGMSIFKADDGHQTDADTKKTAVLSSLRANWLGSAEAMVQQYYGLQGDGARMLVNFDAGDGVGGATASISGSAAPGIDLQLNLDMADFDNITTADGGAGPMYDDRIIAREMVHAVLLRATSNNFSPWFSEGAAQLITGADEKLAAALAGGATAAGIVTNIANGGYSEEGAYVAVRYLHDKLKGLGVAGGIKGLTTYLGAHRSADLGTALKAVTGNVYRNEAAFLTDFRANGAAYINGRMNLANADTGAIGGQDADGGPVRDARDVVADGGAAGQTPLQNFKVAFPNLGASSAGSRRVHVQVGAGAGDLIDMDFSAVDADALGIANLDLKGTAVALLHIDDALAALDRQRVAIGAYGSRLDRVAAGVQTDEAGLAAARERIMGTDVASATVSLTRAQILQQAASAMLSQANGEARAVLALLR
jgi:flagellin